MPQPLVEHISDTAFWVAHYRGLESAKKNALFRDPFASRLAGERGQSIAASMPMAAMTAWVVAIRTCIIDRLILDAINAGVDTIINLGAGLDARPFRMQLPQSLLWVDADFPAVIEYKKQVLQSELPRCRIQWASVQLTDEKERKDFLNRINAQGKKILILTEGVIPYISEEDVAALADELRSLEHVKLWITDYSSAAATERRQKSPLWKQMKNAPLLFNPPDWPGFFANHSWLCKDIQFYSDEARRQKRPMPLSLRQKLMVRLLMFIAPTRVRESLRRSAGFMLLESQA